MKYNEFHDAEFRRNVDRSMKAVERILQVDRKPKLAEDVDHTYQNKYDLADLMSNTFIISIINALAYVGLTVDTLKSVDRNKTTTLRFQANESVEFLSEQVVEVPSGNSSETKEVSKTSGSIFATTEKSTIRKIIRKTKEYHWRVIATWEVSVYSGTDVDSRTVLQSRTSSMVIVRQVDKPPADSNSRHAPVELSLNWLLRMIDTELMAAQFKIDREGDKTKTPRRNEQIDEAFEFVNCLLVWQGDCVEHFYHNIESVLNSHSPVVDTAKHMHKSVFDINSSAIFCPVIPIMEQRDGDAPTLMDVAEDTAGSTGTGQQAILSLKSSGADAANEDGQRSPLLPRADLEKLFSEQIRTMTEQFAQLSTEYPAKQLQRLISTSEACLVMTCFHLKSIAERYLESIGYVEEMLRKQLVSAIGKNVQSHDLDQYMRYHNTKMLDPSPQPFCRAIRRPEHYPDGLLSIEAPDEDGKCEPIETLCRQVVTDESLEVPINAATILQLSGDMFLHGWVRHRFKHTSKSFSLAARARQFSSFVLVIGNMAGPNKLNPKDAIIVQNQDELLIPLLLEELPSAKDFKDAIQSLSPEQQRFAKAFRSMQLESSVFGVCIVQIKPQLEKLLGLPGDSLTKEIQLTQDLMRLFIEYQVPSDLLSFDGAENADLFGKVANVKGHAKTVLDVIAAEKEKQLEEEKKRAQMAIDQQKVRAPETMYAAPPGGQYPPSHKLMVASAPPPKTRNLATKRFRMARSSAPPPSPAPLAFAMESASPVMADNSSVNLHSMPDSAVADSAGNVDVPSSTTTLDQPMNADASTGQVPSSSTTKATQMDFTLIPKVLDASMEKYDPDNALRSTVIKTEGVWTRKRKVNLLTKAESSSLTSDDIKREKAKAFDLLDALSRSGSLAIDSSELHVVVCITHCFENDVMGTVIQDNINPIEKLERSTLLVASAVHGVPARDLVARGGNNLNRLQASFPTLLGDGTEVDSGNSG